MRPFARAEKFRHRHFAKFLAVGIVNTLFGYGVFSLLVLLDVPAGIALFLATVLGVAFNFFTMCRLVFASRGMRRLPHFVAVYGLTFLINLWSLQLLTAAGLSALLAQAILLPVITIFSFALNKLLVFRSMPGNFPP